MEREKKTGLLREMMDWPEYITIGAGLVAVGVGMVVNNPNLIWPGAVLITLGLTSLGVSRAILPKASAKVS